MNKIINEKTVMENEDHKKLYDFFIWFRKNGMEYLNLSIEDMISKYLKERKTK